MENESNVLKTKKPYPKNRASSPRSHCKYGHEFSPENTGYNSRQRYCITCNRVNGKATYAKMTQEQKDLKREKARARKFGITLEELRALLTSDCCSICNAKTSRNTNRKLVVDHCHATGKVRGLLCYACNTAIGLFKDDLSLFKKAVEYIEKNGNINESI